MRTGAAMARGRARRREVPAHRGGDDSSSRGEARPPARMGRLEVVRDGVRDIRTGVATARGHARRREGPAHGGEESGSSLREEARPHALTGRRLEAMRAGMRGLRTWVTPARARALARLHCLLETRTFGFRHLQCIPHANMGLPLKFALVCWSQS